MSLFVAFGAVVCLIILLLRTTKPADRLPPGPRGLPILGNALQLPSKFLFMKLNEWGKEFGPIFTFTAVSQRVVVLNDPHAAVEVLDKMAAATSGRPQFPMANELRLRGMMAAFGLHDERWRHHRRIVHENFNVRQSASYYGIQEKGTEDLLRKLMSDQSNMHRTLGSFTGSVGWIAMYGDTISDMETKIQTMLHMMATLINDMTPTASLVNMFPILKSLPRFLNKWRREGDSWYEESERFLLELARRGSANNTDATFVSKCMQALERDPTMTEVDVAWVAFTLLVGMDTVAAALHFFIAAMVLNPDVVKKAQDHIDAVVGNRLPTFEDRDKLVYVQAMVKELLRWRPISPLGAHHMADETIEYDGYVIPKGSIIIANIWSLTHDPEVFPHPEAFVPERFLDANGELKKAADYHDDLLDFGYGRRICPGRDYAVNMLYITMARLLWAFYFRKAVDGNGKEINPSTTDWVDENLLIYPQDFRFALVPRRKDLTEILSGSPGS